MSSWTIYYNSKCGSCRKALEILKQKKINPHVVEYLKTPPSFEKLLDIANKLGQQWSDLIRCKEPIYTQLHLDIEKMSQSKILKAVVENPVLLQRPIIVHNQNVMIARPPEKIEQMF